MKKTCLVVLAAVGILAMAAAGLAVFAYMRTSSQAAAPLPLAVTITRPTTGGSYPISGGVSVRGQAISGTPITKLELWADGVLIETVTPPAQDMYVFGHTWAWAPGTLGEHTLDVRGFDAGGQARVSSAIHIRGIADPGMLTLVTVSGSDTLDSLAARYHSSVDAIVAANPGLDLNGPLSGEIFVPQPPPGGSLSPSGQAPAATSPQLASHLSLAGWWRLEVVKPLTGLLAPATPGLDATAAGCNVQLTISDSSLDESGFYLYRLDPGSSDFIRIATLGAHAGTGEIGYTDNNLFGDFQYYASAYDNSGESPSGLVVVQVGGAACSELSETFTPTQLVDFGGHQPDQVYLYLSVNGGQAQRIPQMPFQFMSPDTLINLGKAASILAPKQAPVLSLHGEVWGWESGVLVFLGSFDRALPPSLQPSGAQDLALPSTELHIRVNNPLGPISNEPWLWVDEAQTRLGTEYFEWSTGSPEATGGQWQISSLPFTSNLDPNPPGLLLTGPAPGPLKGALIEFPADLSSLNPNHIPTVQLPNQGKLSLSTIPHLPPFGPPFYRLSNGANTLTAIAEALGLPSNGQPSASPNLVRPTLSGIYSADLFIRYYARILPMQGDQPVGVPSNTVFLDYYPASGNIAVTVPPPPVRPYELKITDVQPIHFPQSPYLLCVIITDNPYYDDPNGFAAQHPLEVPLYELYAPNDTECPVKIASDKSLLQEIVGDLEDALNFVSNLYNDLSDIVVSALDKVNPACAVSQDVCHSIDVLVVDAAKTYAGLPPSIPNADELKGLGENYLADLAIQKLEAANIPCPEDCQNKIKSGIDDIFTQVQESWSNSGCVSAQQAAEYGVKPLCLPPGVKSKPDPRGQYADGVVTVQVALRPGFTQADIPAYCDLGVAGSADNSLWVGKVLGLTGPFGANQGYLQWQGTPLSSSLALINRTAVAIPKLAENETISIPVSIGRNSEPFWIPGHEKLWQGFVPGPYDDDWIYLYHGATLGLHASSVCAQDPSSTYQIGPAVGPLEDVPVQ
jgi:phage tail protein X